MAEQPSEEVLLDTENIKVTTARAILGGKTYAMSNITSVRMAKASAIAIFPVLGIAIGAILMLGGFATIRDLGRPLLFVLGLAFVAGGLLSLIRAEPTYHVRTGSPSGEADVMSSKDQATIQTIVDAMNNAIVKRGS
jgi:hypothetical protein